MDPSTIEIPILSDLTLVGVISFTLAITLVDVIGAYLAAIAQTYPDGSRKFDARFMANWLVSHSIKRVFPIYALALLGVGIPAAGIPEIPALFIASTVGVAGYLGETVKSVLFNFHDARAIRDETPIPPAR